MDTPSGPASAEEAAVTRTLIREAPYAYLAMTEPEGPYVSPLNFAFAEESATPAATEDSKDQTAGLRGTIYFHTGKGRKTAALAADPRVCLAVTAGVAFLRGDGPCENSFSYRSLLIWGRARRIDDPAGREMALRAIVSKYDPEGAGMPFDEGVFEQTLVYELAIDTATYKQKP